MLKKKRKTTVGRAPRTGTFNLALFFGARCAPYVFMVVFSFISTIANAKTILIVGDSLSAGYGIDIEKGWVNLLQEKLNAASTGEHKVVNASISGDTTGAGLARLPLLLKQHSPDIVVIELGGNDGLQGFPLKIMRTNLSQMVDLSLESGAKVLMLGVRIPPNYGERYTESFFNIFHEIATEKQISLKPFFIESVALEAELMQSDGIHPKATAQPQIVADVWPHLESLLN